jgi:hypothetical protein
VVRRAAAHLHAVIDPDGAEAALQRTYDRRGVTLSVSGDRAYLDGVLDIESAEVLRTALAPLMSRAGATDSRSTPQRRADALVDLATRALNSGTLPELGGQRPHLSVVIDEAALRTRVGAATLPWTGVTLPAGAVRRWACDASLTPVLARLVDGAWQPLDVGRSRRLASHAQLTALRVRCPHGANDVGYRGDMGGADVSVGQLSACCRQVVAQGPGRAGEAAGSPGGHTCVVRKPAGRGAVSRGRRDVGRVERCDGVEQSGVLTVLERH